jgi:16S rRNA (guanine966-N2)-methyltransferase
MPARIKKNHRVQKSPSYGKKNRPERAEMGSFRVIGGEWRSRRLTFPAIEGLRPTTDRVKETVFNWLLPYLPGAHVVDLFSGSGSLGIEALSRGAETLFSIELDSNAAGAIRHNYEQLKITDDRANVVNMSAFDWLAAQTNECQSVDLVFLDPPFRKGFLDEAISLLAESQILKDRSLIYLEREKEGQAPDIPASWVLLKEKVAGQVCYQLYQRQD